MTYLNELLQSIWADVQPGISALWQQASESPVAALGVACVVVVLIWSYQGARR